MTLFQVIKPHFLVFDYTDWDLKGIRDTLYEDYAYFDSDIIPSVQLFREHEGGVDEMIDEYVSLLAFNDEEQYRFINSDEDIDLFYGVYQNKGWKFIYDLEQIMLMDLVCFEDNTGIIRNQPHVEVW